MPQRLQSGKIQMQREIYVQFVLEIDKQLMDLNGNI
jgi:hypothetical protein